MEKPAGSQGGGGGRADSRYITYKCMYQYIVNPIIFSIEVVSVFGSNLDRYNCQLRTTLFSNKSSKDNDLVLREIDTEGLRTFNRNCCAL